MEGGWKGGGRGVEGGGMGGCRKLYRIGGCQYLTLCASHCPFSFLCVTGFAVGRSSLGARAGGGGSAVYRIGSCKELPLCASHNPRRVRKIHLHIGGSIPPSPAVRSTRELHEDLSREGGQRAEGGQSGGRSANKTIEGGASCHQRMRPCLASSGMGGGGRGGVRGGVGGVLLGVDRGGVVLEGE